MQTRTRPLWILSLVLIASFALAACVRPYPGGEPVNVDTLPQPVTTLPAVLPQPTVAFPDNGVATVEPVPVEPSVEAVAPTAEIPAVDTIHTVVAGDTLFKIALQYDVTIDEITAVNDIPDINRLEIGQQITIPAPGSVVPVEPGDSAGTDTGTDTVVATPLPAEVATVAPPVQGGGVHVVQPGENLFRIGLQYGCTVNQMAAANGIVNPTRIFVGQELTVPDCN